MGADVEKWNSQIFQEQVVYDLMSVIISSPLPIDLRDDISIFGKEEAARKFVRTHWHQFFFRKHPDWRHEQEYRWLVHSPDTTEKFVSIEGALKQVIVSIDFPNDCISSLIKSCQKLNVPVKRLKWQDGIPLVEKEWEILYNP
jgi:hypothetical protein